MRVCTLSDFIWFRYIMKTMNEDLKSVSFRETVITTPWSEETSIELKLKREASEQERDERALRWYKFLEMGDSTKPPLFWLPVGPSKGSGRGSHFPQDSTVIWLVLCISECSKRNLEVILFRCDFFTRGVVTNQIVFSGLTVGSLFHLFTVYRSLSTFIPYDKQRKPFSPRGEAFI